jgi:sugar phosphate isomerase/epimerase
MPERVSEAELTRRFGLKLGSRDTGYADDILSLHDAGYFQYIELFAVPGSYDDTMEHWKRFRVPFVVHAPHSHAGMNPSLPENREGNKAKIREAFRFADALKAERVIFHPGVDGDLAETIIQLAPFADERCLIENKPAKGLNGERCLGSTPAEIARVARELGIGHCLDFGHAICAANSLGREPLEFIGEFIALAPVMYHLTDGDFSGERDMHLHYGEGDFPLRELLGMIPADATVTNEAKHDSGTSLEDFKRDILYARAI